MEVTIFKNLRDIMNPHFISVDDALDRIRTGRSKEMVESIRSASEEERRSLKTKLPAYVFAGRSSREVMVTNKKTGELYPSKRTDDSVETHSGFFVLDIDDVKDESYIRGSLYDNPYVYAYFTSPSGRPKIKALVRCEPNVHYHAAMYQAFINAYPDYRLDTTSRNIGRLCFESFDPALVKKHIDDVKVWSKRASEEDVKEEKKVDVSIKTDWNKIAIAAQMIRNSMDGEKHSQLVKAAFLLGGYKDIVREEDALRVLREEIRAKPGVKDIALAEQTILDGYERGKSRPISEAKKIERAQHYVLRDDGEFNFLADMKKIRADIDDQRANGVKYGRTTGISTLDTYFLHKENNFNVFLGFDNVGKTTIMLYLAMMDALVNGSRYLIHSNENQDVDLVDDLISFYCGRKTEKISEIQLDKAFEWVNAHFKIISGERDVYSHMEVLDIAAAEFEKSGPYDVVVIEPWNSMIRKGEELKMDKYEHNIFLLSQYNLFKKNYCSIYAFMHAVTGAARKEDDDGNQERPRKYHADGGQIIPNRADDFMVIHRNVSDPHSFMETELYMDKVKRTKTGGMTTFKTSPVTLSFKRSGDYGNFGFVDVRGIDPLHEYTMKRDDEAPQKIDFPEMKDDDDLPF